MTTQTNEHARCHEADGSLTAPELARADAVYDCADSGSSPPLIDQVGVRVFDTILVGTDGSKTAAVAVAQATELARLMGSTLHIASVTKPVPRSAIANASADDFTDDARRALHDAAEPARAAGVRVETHAVMGAPAHALVELAEKVHADVMVVGNRGMNRRLFGSVPNAVTHHAPCSVMIVETQHHT